MRPAGRSLPIPDLDDVASALSTGILFNVVVRLLEATPFCVT